MLRYHSLIKFTDTGASNVQDSIQRATAFGRSVELAGGKLVAQYWALGAFDGCVIFEAPDDKTATRLLVQLARDGFVRTQTMQVFDNKEAAELLNH
ncbi:GYD domain protein [Stieleria maiorica]|uniref:GYD domain protein n=1 Tax=Stieleria maiorica TaxID=2795974 RepID=A0A5B9MDV2_9BACT|nr:GYD domain-containing protein [Stieleria maiorica]QEF97784.1 GYD domain protein [Stieleria maiorica]